MTYALVVFNPNPPTDKNPWIAASVSVNVTFTNAQGQVVGSESPTVGIVAPGQYAATGDDSSKANGVTDMKVQASVDRWQQNDKPITGTFTASGVSTTPDTYGGGKTLGTITSTFAQDYKQLRTSAVYSNDAGQIIGGAFTYVDFVPANGTSSFSISASDLPPGIAKTDVYTSLSNLSLLANSSSS